jgi:hypothetical protein
MIIFDYLLRVDACGFFLSTRNPRKIPSEIFTIPRAVKMKFGLIETISPMKIPVHPAMRNITVMIPSLRRDGVGIDDFSFCDTIKH